MANKPHNTGRPIVHAIIYLVGLFVIVLALLNFIA